MIATNGTIHIICIITEERRALVELNGRQTWHKLYYNKAGESYFKKLGHRYYPYKEFYKVVSKG